MHWKRDVRTAARNRADSDGRGVLSNVEMLAEIRSHSACHGSSLYAFVEAASLPTAETPSTMQCRSKEYPMLPRILARHCLCSVHRMFRPRCIGPRATLPDR